MSKPVEIVIVRLTEAERDGLLQRLAGAVSLEDQQLIARLICGVSYLLDLMDGAKMSIRRLRRMIFGAKTEQSARVLPRAAGAPAAPAGSDPAPGRPKRKGHGRLGAKAYPGASRVHVPHPALEAGGLCADCGRGKLYPFRPAVLVRIVAQPLLRATVYAIGQLRCALCGKVFTAPAPPEAGREKYSPAVGIMLAVQRYGVGMPFYRIAKWQACYGVPLPATTQWELVNAAAPAPEAAYEALLDAAAQGRLLHNDDTTMRVQSIAREIAQADEPEERTGVFTSSIVAQAGTHQIALFFTGRRHAGENLAQLLQRRAPGLAPPLQMCDALSRNEPKGCATDLCHCLLHGRRHFVDLVESFPEESRKVIESLREVYRCEAAAKENGLSDLERLVFHQARSGTVLEELQRWMNKQMEGRRLEPNSGLGQAIRYMLKHWETLTRFLYVPGAPLDNNVCERSLKMAILHRKNSLGYKTERGSRVGDVFMSLIHTCQLGGLNPHTYLLALLENAGQVLLAPSKWLPWNYPGGGLAADTG